MLKKLESYWYNELRIKDLGEEYNFWLRLTDYADVYDEMAKIMFERKALRDENRRILEVINLLDGKQKIVMYLHCVKHTKWQAVARQLGISNEYTHRLKRKALAQLEGVEL